MRARSSDPQLDMRNRKSPTSLHRDPVVSACSVSASERRQLVLQPSLVARSMVFSFTDAYVRTLLASVASTCPHIPAASRRIQPDRSGEHGAFAALTLTLAQVETSDRALCDFPADGRVLAADGPIRYVEASVRVGARLTLPAPAGQNPSQVRGACSGSYLAGTLC